MLAELQEESNVSSFTLVLPLRLRDDLFRDKWVASGLADGLRRIASDPDCVEEVTRR
jgi:hypothetical protein